MAPVLDYRFIVSHDLKSVLHGCLQDQKTPCYFPVVSRKSVGEKEMLVGFVPNLP